MVTGSSRGIGRAIALRLAKDGFDLALHYLQNRAQVEALAAEIEALGRRARILQFDIADRSVVESRLSADMAEYGAYYGLVLNAGIARDAAFPMLTGDDWDQVMRTNLDGFYNVLTPCVMPMVRRRKPGRIVTLASVSGLVGNRGQVNYSAAKAGIIGATKALALELAKRNITVNCVAPGVIETEMTAGLDVQQVLPLIPQQRLGTPEEVAGAVSFLCSADAAYVTRQVLSVNGGMC